MFLSWLGLKGPDCMSFRSQSDYIDYFELDEMVDARPPGYKVKLQFSVLPNKTSGIVLSMEVDKTESSYEIRMLNIACKVT